MRTSALSAVILSSLAILHSPKAASQDFVLPNAVDPIVLASVRGGFAYGDNLIVTLGIDRVVRINGNEIERSSLEFGDVGRLTIGSAQLVGGAAQGTKLIQNGLAGATVSNLVNGALAGTVIQNTLNDQLISSQTTIRASVNSAGMMPAMNFSATLNQALNNAVSAR